MAQILDQTPQISCLRFTRKSGFGPVDTSKPYCPIVMRPASSKHGHLSLINWIRELASSGEQPLFSEKNKKNS